MCSPSRWSMSRRSAWAIGRSRYSVPTSTGKPSSVTARLTPVASAVIRTMNQTVPSGNVSTRYVARLTLVTTKTVRRRRARSGTGVPTLDAVFDALSERLQQTLADVRSRGTLTEDDINKAMREIRLALLEADVNFRVVKDFTTRVKERALGADVVGQLNPGQQVVKIVHEELAALMGGAGAQLA